MGEICENCGAEIREGAQFCQECGSKIERPENTETVEPDSDNLNFCPNCGEEISESEIYCKHCGVNLNTLEIPEKKENLIEKYKIPIIVAIIAVIVILSGLIISSMMTPDYSDVTLPAQTVAVGAEYFKIPGGFSAVPGSFDIDTGDYVFSNSETWSNGQDHINIAVMSSGVDVDLESVAGSEGGVHKTLMGYEGYYSENDIDDYSFTFVMDDKICVIETTSPYLFDEIEVL